jgi:hypothetical protein
MRGATSAHRLVLALVLPSLRLFSKLERLEIEF